MSYFSPDFVGILRKAVAANIITPEETCAQFEKYVKERQSKDANGEIIIEFVFPKILLEASNRQNCLEALHQSLQICQFTEVNTATTETKLKMCCGQFAFCKKKSCGDQRDNWTETVYCKLTDPSCTFLKMRI